MSRNSPSARRASTTNAPKRSARRPRHDACGVSARPLRDRFSALELLENRTLLSTYQVTSTADTDTAGTLRWAIEQANANAGADTINFAFDNGTGTPSQAGTIQLGSPLDAITDAVTLTGNVGANGAPLVVLDGSNAGAGAVGLDFEGAGAAYSAVSGLAVVNFNGAGMVVNTTHTLITGVYVGLGSDGAAGANTEGIILSLGNNIVENSVVSGNADIGISVAGDGNQILRDYVGVDPTGTHAIPNGGNGVEVNGASNTAVSGNVIASNGGSGIRVKNSTNTQIAGNLIGTDATGTVSLAQVADDGTSMSGSGIRLDTGATGTTVGGSSSSDRNVISGNGGNGVDVATGAGSGNLILGNYIGTDATGTVALGNDGNGVNAAGSGVVISDNLIAGNNGNGIFLSGASTVSGNTIGADITGSTAMPNSGDGVYVSGSGNTISGNLLSGNYGNGVTLNGNGNTVTGNLIGTAADGQSPLGGNGGGANSYGVYVLGSDNVIGAAGAGNVVAYNGGAGVVVDGQGNAVRFNSVYANGNVGIDLGEDGRTTNEQGNLYRDGSGSSNNYQNFPVITGVAYDPDGNVLLSGVVYGDHDGTYTVDVYSNQPNDVSFDGQAGRMYIGSFTVTVTNGSGTFSGEKLGKPCGGDTTVVATATDDAGNTSEFSVAAALPSAANADTSTTLTSDQSHANYGSTVTFTATVTALCGSLAPTGTVSFFEQMADGSMRLLGTGSVLGDGTARFSTSALSLGHHAIVAVYNADPGFNTSQSAPLDQAVTDFSVTILSSSTTISQPGQAVTFTAVVSPGTAGSGTPTGSVIFYDGDTAISGSVTLVTDANGVTSAVFTTTSLSVGTHVITAMYSGDADYQGSTSNSLDETVNTPPPANTISGHVYRDTSGNGLSADDTALAGVTVKLFTDSNNNGVYDSGDALVTSAVSGADGSYSFGSLANGRYFVVEVGPSGYIRTAPATSSYYTENASGSSYTADFDNYKKCSCSSNVVNIWYTISGLSGKYTDLRGHTHEGQTVTVHFTVLAHHTETLSFVTYTAPGSSFDANTASQQVIYNYQTGTFTAGSTNKSFSMTVKIPKCDYQIDFVCGQMIDTFGPAGSNIFYSPQGRLFSADNGGTHSPFGVTPIGGTVLDE